MTCYVACRVGIGEPYRFHNGSDMPGELAAVLGVAPRHRGGHSGERGNDRREKSVLRRFGDLHEMRKACSAYSRPGRSWVSTSARMFGRYVDRVERRAGEWRIARRVVVFEATPVFTGEAPALKPEWAQLARRPRPDLPGARGGRVGGFGHKVAHLCYSAGVEPGEQEERIGVRELRQHASRYVALAKAGRRIPVTERGKLVAYLVPAEEPTSIFDRLEAAGQLRRATGRISDLLPVPPAPPGAPSLSETLQRMRDEERW